MIPYSARRLPWCAVWSAGAVGELFLLAPASMARTRAMMFPCKILFPESFAVPLAAAPRALVPSLCWLPPQR